MLAAELLSGVHAVASVALARALRTPVLRLTARSWSPPLDSAGHLATVIAMNERFTVPPQVWNSQRLSQPSQGDQR